MGGGTGGTGPPQTFQFLTLCLWALHGKNRLQMVLVLRAVTLPLQIPLKTLVTF